MCIRDSFEGYTEHVTRVEFNPYNDGIEHPCMTSLLRAAGAPFGNTLDLGAGAGRVSLFLLKEDLSARVTLLDPSAQMLRVARERLERAGVMHRAEVEQCAAEAVELPSSAFDAVVSSLALHYVEDFDRLCARVFEWLTPGGVFVFTTEHPMTACVPDSVPRKVTIEGETRYIVDSYHEEGVRLKTWFVDQVITYHRTTSTIVNGLLRAGFCLEEMQEPNTAPQFAEHPERAPYQQRPLFVAVSYTHLRAHETVLDLVCRLLLEKKKKYIN
eukprot:TRINITY_DN27952_c0_g1_i1.p1 TRINITY_DN27952_c0_g1~~TRINITY_DN27952_c0_g1_i1.p1  ORF type:complete len:271 (+),score=59.65 TRINITY_DN27952_c0_g1_i1:134-946(+)